MLRNQRVYIANTTFEYTNTKIARITKSILETSINSTCLKKTAGDTHVNIADNYTQQHTQQLCETAGDVK